MFVDDSFFAVILAWSNKKREFRYLCDLISSKSTNINHNTKIDNPFLKKKRDYISHTIHTLQNWIVLFHQDLIYFLFYFLSKSDN